MHGIQLLFNEFFNEIHNYLDLLSKMFQNYFPEDVRIGNLWIMYPFMCDIALEDVNLPTVTENKTIFDRKLYFHNQIVLSKNIFYFFC